MWLRYPAVAALAAVFASGCTNNPLFGLDGGASGTDGKGDATTGPGLEDTGSGTRGPGGDDPTAPDDDDDHVDDDDDDDDDAVDTGDDDDDDDQAETGTECRPVAVCVSDDSCTRDEKCSLYHFEGGDDLDAIGCVPLAGEPAAEGEPCVVDACGLDNCGLGLVCPRNDPEAMCVSLCASGDVCEAGSCVDVVDNGALGLCAPQCDLLAQNCFDPSQACYVLADVIACAPLGNGLQNQVCQFGNQCAPGFACVSDSNLDNCAGLELCCTGLCEVDGDPCPDSLTCVDAMLVEAEGVGVCVD